MPDRLTSSRLLKNGVGRRCERRGVGYKAPRRRRCRGASVRSGNAVDGPAPPQPLAASGSLLASAGDFLRCRTRAPSRATRCKKPDATPAAIFQHPAYMAVAAMNRQLGARGASILAAAAIAAWLLAACSARAVKRPAPAPTPTPAPPTATPVPSPTPSPQAVFEQSIRPILSSHCAPCHEPGGKMYKKLPFDDLRVLASHSEGALRRLKGDDRDMFARWAATFTGIDPDTKK
jgi:hypothetical protein